ncbi:Integrase, catalytic core [Corchorus capsularis]|uniref:Integrase, catalytic core n=1 Tax=Corchorus capsularis TaxID=210143 RepID=A0A1R3GYJ1_COCAP|nr:Integrase, catalytic core [Corchorus capsularis]
MASHSTSSTDITQINATNHLPLKLNSTNFPSWQLQLDSLLVGLDLNGYVDGTHPCPAKSLTTDGTATLNPAFTKWVRQDKLILHAIVVSVSEAVVPMIVSSKSSQEAMSKLTNIFAGKTRSRVMSLKKKLTLSTQGTKSVADYIQSVRSTADELALAQAPVSEDDQIIFILNGLNPEFREISTAIRARETAISLEELHDKLTDFEAVIKQDELTAAPTIMAHLTTRGKGPQNRNYVQPRGNNFRASTPVANIVQSSNYVDAQNWVVDSAATNHVTSDLNNLSLYTDYGGPEEILVGDGSDNGGEYESLSSLLASHGIKHLQTPPHTPQHNGVSERKHRHIVETVQQVSAAKALPVVSDDSLVSFIPSTSVPNSPVCSVVPSSSSVLTSSQEWREAMTVEFNALVNNGTWTLVPPCTGQNVVGNKWVYRIKRKPDGSIDRFKARLVAKGFHQRPGLDFTETFSPVIKPTTIRTVLCIALSSGWSLKQLDVNNAFLQGTLTDEEYMAQPPGFEDKDHPSHVCKLHKAIYGLKQAPRAWYQELSTFLLQYGFINSTADASLFVYKSGSDVIYFLVYVDDLIVTGNNQHVVDQFLAQLSHRFSLKDLGNLNFFLGVEVISTASGLFLSQHKYIRDLLDKFDMSNAKETVTPMAAGIQLKLQDGTSPADATLQTISRLLAVSISDKA